MNTKSTDQALSAEGRLRFFRICLASAARDAKLNPRFLYLSTSRDCETWVF